MALTPGFLYYESRSGSTILSKLLYGHPDVLVTSDCRFVASLIESGFDMLPNVQSMRDVMDVLLSDKKFRDWQLDHECLESRLEKLHFPMPLSAVVHTVLDAYRERHKPNASLVIVKHAAYFFHRDALRLYVPAAPLIHIIRDGRDVFLSQSRAERTDTGKPMANSVLFFAYIWRKYARGFLADAQDIKVLYEDLVTDPRTVLSALFERMGIDPERLVQNGNKNGYESLIPHDQRHLHTNLKREVLAGNTEKWRSAMSIWDRRLFEWVAGEELRALGYAIDSTSLSLHQKLIAIGKGIKDLWQGAIGNVHALTRINRASVKRFLVQVLRD